MMTDPDYIIVGSGIAATLVADRLLEENPLTSKYLLGIDVTGGIL